MRFNIFPNRQYLFIISVYILVWMILFAIFKLYTRKYRFSLPRTFNSIIAGFFVNSSVTYFFNQYAYSREVIVTATILLLIVLLTYRGIMNLYKFIISKNIMLNKVNLLVIGDKKLNQDLEEKFNLKYNVFYLNKSGEYNYSKLVDFIRIKNIREVVFSTDYFSNQEILKAMWSLKDSNIVFKIVPTANELILSKLHSNINNLSLIEIEYNINNKMNIFFKRLFDMCLSSVLLIFVYPVILIVKKLMKHEFSKQTDKLFLLPKVFSGKYSFVGIPDWYELKEKDYLGKRGLTGLIQLNHFNDISEDELMSYNVYYAKNQSFILDLEILLKTFFYSLKKNNI